MKKDFQKWHKTKSGINDTKGHRFYHEREVWWCSVGLNVGYEMDGKGKDFVRPILVIKGFSKEVFLCIPLTTKLKQGKYYCDIDLGDGQTRRVILSQIRLIDAKRLQEKITMIDIKQFEKIKKAVIAILA
ncbi:type II toxin-antitoxin system PemK/MazF family toxin [Candidatus Microgenomates bacterium]|nr:type II toxin-antitoxin system PemK/MazF family toxin [Candidatus Microgenomates bacterium]